MPVRTPLFGYDSIARDGRLASRPERSERRGDPRWIRRGVSTNRTSAGTRSLICRRPNECCRASEASSRIRSRSLRYPVCSADRAVSFCTVSPSRRPPGEWYGVPYGSPSRGQRWGSNGANDARASGRRFGRTLRRAGKQCGISVLIRFGSFRKPDNPSAPGYEFDLHTEAARSATADRGDFGTDRSVVSSVRFRKRPRASCGNGVVRRSVQSTAVAATRPSPEARSSDTRCLRSDRPVGRPRRDTAPAGDHRRSSSARIRASVRACPRGRRSPTRS